MYSNKQGNGLFVVLIVLTALSFGIYSAFELVNGERRFNKRAVVYDEAKQATESLLQSAVATLVTRYSNSATILSDDLTALRPLGIDGDWLNFYLDEDSGSSLDPTSIEIKGGLIMGPEWVKIDPLEPGYEYDSAAGKWGRKRSVELLAKTTVDHPVIGPVSAYASQHVEIRDIPLFAYAIFYNVVMEIAPGPVMNIYEAVHSNYDIWYQANNGLNFRGRVTTAGDIYHGRRIGNSSNGDVKILNGLGQLVSMKRNITWPFEAFAEYNRAWLESSGNNFRETANQVFNGNLQTREHDVPVENLPGVRNYIERPGNQQSFNPSYQIIQPVLNRDEIESEALENIKFAYNASLTIEVDTTTNTLTYFTYDRDEFNRIRYNGDGSPIRIPLIPPREFAKTFLHSDNTSSLHDKRQETDIDFVQIDMSVLREMIHAVDDNPSDASLSWGLNPEQNPTAWWRGVVYVQFPQQGVVRPDNVDPARDRNWGVKLINGSIIPNPNFAINESILGTTVATNQMMYVQGNYNADGNLATGSETEPEPGFAQKDREAPAALVADAITFLSNSWVDSASKSTPNAAETEVSAAMITGVVPTVKSGSYSGGVENLPRFLERWTNIDFMIRGSLVALYESEVANERWGKDGVYNAPRRRWGFHTSFGEGLLPPGTPFTRNIRSRFQLLNENQYNTRSLRINTGSTEGSWIF